MTADHKFFDLTWLKISCFPLTVGCTFLAFSICRGTQTLNMGNALTVALLTCAFTFFLEYVCKQFLQIQLSKTEAFCFLAVAGLFFVFCITAPQAAYTFPALTELIAVACIPVAAAVLRCRQGSPFSLLPLIGIVFAFIYCLLHTGGFSPDSFAYHEMAKTLFSDFGKVETVRQYVIPTDYSISFPYFFPLMIALAARFTGLGIYAGVLLNLFFVCATVVLLICFSRQLTGAFWPGEFCSFILLVDTAYLSEVFAARSIPANIFFTCAAVGLFWTSLLSPSPKRRLLWIEGLCAGISAVIRFDSAAFLCFFVVLCFLFSASGKRLKNTAILVSGAILPLLPWLCYSIFRFQTLWVSDNTQTALRVETHIPTYVYLPTDSTLTLWNSPSAWLKALFSKCETVLSQLFTCSPFAWYFILISVLALLFTILLRPKGQSLRTLLQDPFLCFFGSVCFFYLCKTGVYCLIGYPDTRYHSETVLLVSFATALTCARHIPFSKLQKPLLKTGFRLIAFCCVVLLFLSPFISGPRSLELPAHGYPLQQIAVTPAAELEVISAMDEALPPEASVFFLSNESFGYYVGGWTSRRIYVEPSNVGVPQVQFLLRNFVDADYLLFNTSLSSADDLLEFLERNYTCIDPNFVSSYALYQLK